MTSFRTILLLTAITLMFNVKAQQPYFPEKDNWQSQAPRALGFDSDKLKKAVQFAKGNEYSGDKDLRIAILKGFAKEPFHEILGPTKKRGGPAGLIIKDGYIAAQWGDLERVEMTFSVTKSYLSTMAGLAKDAKLLNSVDDPVNQYVWDGTFDGQHNGKITWRHLLDQSSDWSGELFGIKDWADRPPAEGGLDEWKYRQLQEPGTVMEYNDVRVNVLAYSLLQVWRQPLPQVLKQRIMDPVGASTTWRWFGYDHAWTNVDGIKMQSVTGGGHSGGGVFVSTLDQARFGLLFLNNGKWKDQQLISKDWVKSATTASKPNPSYGFMWWLNQGPRAWKNVDEPHLFYAAGFGGNFVVIDQKRQLMVVTRWLEPRQIGQMMELVLDSL